MASIETREELTRRVKQMARDVGFDRVGVCLAEPTPGYERLLAWIERGYGGQMSYIADRAGAYCHPESVMAGVESIVMLALDYGPPDQPNRVPRHNHGFVARYASGQVDYHDLIRHLLNEALARLSDLIPTVTARGVVDTAPLHEREFGRLAGLGWIGKNTLLISPQHGSYFFLAAILLDQPLMPDAPIETDHCGSCTACLDACPTDAFPAPRLLDARKCISYLTIERRGALTESERSQIAPWLFGCDVCQEVCPWNRFAPETSHHPLEPLPHRAETNLVRLFFLSDRVFRREYRTTPMWRTKRRGLLRNAAYLLGARRSPSALGALTRGLHDDEPTIRAAAAWGLGRLLPHAAARRHLHRRLEREQNWEVADEIANALRPTSLPDNDPASAADGPCRPHDEEA